MADGDQPEFKRLCKDDTNDESVDRLSYLPVEILYSILASLNTVEVVRTCVLSRSWRNIWVSIPYLNFNLAKYDGYVIKREWFWKFVESVLLGRNENHIIKRLHLYFRFYHGVGEKENFQYLLRLAAMQTVEELDICTYGEDTWFEKLSLSRHLSESVKILKVKARLDIALQVKSDFSNLRSLYLKGVILLDNDTVSQLLFDTLEELHLENCCMEEVTVVDISAPNLKKLTFVNKCSYIDEVDYSLQLLMFLGELKLWAPKLAYFYYSGPVLSKFTLHNLSSLVDAHIHLSQYSKVKDHELDLPFIIRELIQVKRLKLSAFTLPIVPPFRTRTRMKLIIIYASLLLLVAAMAYNEHTCKFDMLPNLICLTLDIILFRNMEQLLYLLKLSPRLQTLTITLKKSDQLTDCFYERDHQWAFLDWDIECIRNSLEVVKIYEFIPSATETEMVELLLQYGKVLDHIHIVSRKPIPYHIKPDSAQKNIQKILSFPKSSGKVSLSFH